jgi:hypothetical protein
LACAQFPYDAPAAAFGSAAFLVVVFVVGVGFGAAAARCVAGARRVVVGATAHVLPLHGHDALTDFLAGILVDAQEATLLGVVR